MLLIVGFNVLVIWTRGSIFGLVDVVVDVVVGLVVGIGVSIFETGKKDSSKDGYPIN